MIKGIGVDLIEVSRVRDSISRFGAQFLERIFTKNELLEADKLKDSAQYYGFLAKRFAAKEAYAKALGTGIGSHISFKEIEITNSQDGRPQLLDLTKSDDTITHISLSDTEEYATAYIIIEKI